jgi:hypothetical protein
VESNHCPFQAVEPTKGVNSSKVRSIAGSDSGFFSQQGQSFIFLGLQTFSSFFDLRRQLLQIYLALSFSV